MNCFKKRAMFITAGFLGIGGYILYQNLKTRVDDLEEEIWGMEDENYDDFDKATEEIVLEKVEFNNADNELHDEVQNHLKDLEEEQKHNEDENK